MKIIGDYRAYNLTPLGLIKGFLTGHTFYAVLLYRVGNFLAEKKIPFLPYMVIPFQRIFFSCEISPYASIGEGLKIYHSNGIIIGHDCKIGKNVEVFQNVTIGGNNKVKNNKTMPVIGDNVSIYSGACVAGPIVISDNVKIGSNVVVTRDIAANSIVKTASIRIIDNKLI